MYTGRPHGSSGPVPLIILGVVFLVVGFVVSIPAARSIMLIFQLLGAILIIAGVVWLLVRRNSAPRPYLSYGDPMARQPGMQPMPMPMPNTLGGTTPGGTSLDPATGGQVPAGLHGTVMMQGPMVYQGGQLMLDSEGVRMPQHARVCN